MAKQSYQWDAGTITVQPPAGAPEGCPPCELSIGVVTVSWGENDPVVQVDWVGFRTAIVQSPAFKRIVAFDLVTFTMLNSVMWLIASDPSKAIETVQYWNQLAALADPTAEEIAELNGIAAEHHAPFVLDEYGMM
jgi:hypothetical protein